MIQKEKECDKRGKTSKAKRIIEKTQGSDTYDSQ
jgi:hypothetical protein